MYMVRFHEYQTARFCANVAQAGLCTYTPQRGKPPRDRRAAGVDGRSRAPRLHSQWRYRRRIGLQAALCGPRPVLQVAPVSLLCVRLAPPGGPGADHGLVVANTTLTLSSVRPPSPIQRAIVLS